MSKLATRMLAATVAFITAWCNMGSDMYRQVLWDTGRNAVPAWNMVSMAMSTIVEKLIATRQESASMGAEEDRAYMVGMAMWSTLCCHAKMRDYKDAGLDVHTDVSSCFVRYLTFDAKKVGEDSTESLAGDITWLKRRVEGLERAKE